MIDLPSTCWLFPQVHQAPVELFHWSTKHLLRLFIGLPSTCWLFPRFTKHLLGCFPGLAWLCPRFTKHLLGCFPALPSTCDKSVKIWFFVKMTIFFWFAAACGGGAFLFYIKKLFYIKSLPFVAAHQRVRLPYFLCVFW